MRTILKVAAVQMLLMLALIVYREVYQARVDRAAEYQEDHQAQAHRSLPRMGEGTLLMFEPSHGPVMENGKFTGKRSETPDPSHPERQGGFLFIIPNASGRQNASGRHRSDLEDCFGWVVPSALPLAKQQWACTEYVMQAMVSARDR